MEENKSALDKFGDKLFPNYISMLAVPGFIFMLKGFIEKDKGMLYMGGFVMGIGYIAREIGKRKEKKETIE